MRKENNLCKHNEQNMKTSKHQLGINAIPAQTSVGY